MYLNSKDLLVVGLEPVKLICSYSKKVSGFPSAALVEDLEVGESVK